jgi:hypothetical protein
MDIPTDQKSPEDAISKSQMVREKISDGLDFGVYLGGAPVRFAEPVLNLDFVSWRAKSNSMARCQFEARRIDTVLTGPTTAKAIYSFPVFLEDVYPG